MLAVFILYRKNTVGYTKKITTYGLFNTMKIPQKIESESNKCPVLLDTDHHSDNTQKHDGKSQDKLSFT